MSVWFEKQEINWTKRNKIIDKTDINIYNNRKTGQNKP